MHTGHINNANLAKDADVFSTPGGSLGVLSPTLDGNCVKWSCDGAEPLWITIIIPCLVFLTWSCLVDQSQSNAAILAAKR